MVEIFLVRHGETEENVAQILQGTLPGHLTERGCQQAEQLGENLAEMNLKFDELWTSPLLRAMQTAHIVNRHLHLPVVTCDLLHERDWGSITGASIPLPPDFAMPDDVETVDHMFQRAHDLMNRWWNMYAGQRLLVVSHGLFNRVMLAAWKGLAIRDIPRMNNGEVRRIVIESEPATYLLDEIHHENLGAPTVN